MSGEFAKWWLRMWCVLLPLSAILLSINAWRGNWRDAFREVLWIAIIVLFIMLHLVEKALR